MFQIKICQVLILVCKRWLCLSGIMPPNPLVYHHFPMKCVFWEVFHMLRQIKKHTLDICIYIHVFLVYLCIYFCIICMYVCRCMHGWMDVWMYLCMDGWMDVRIYLCVWKLLVTCSSKHASIFSTTCKVCQGIEWSWHQQRPSLFPVIWKRDAFSRTCQVGCDHLLFLESVSGQLRSVGSQFAATAWG